MMLEQTVEIPPTVGWMVPHISVKSVMNGIIKLKLLLDINIIIDFFKQTSTDFDLFSLFLQAEVVTRDSHFLECQYKKLQVWKI